MDLRSYIRDVPDFPEPGVGFKDITPLLADPKALAMTIEQLADGFEGVDVVVGIDARGFIFAPAVALKLGVGFVPVRKRGKLPFEVESVEYGLEYGRNELEMHVDAIQDGQSVLVCDDVLATGGTAAATAELVTRSGGTVAAFSFAIEIVFLGGRAKLGATPARSLVRY